jgi:hypothetical protein
MKTYKNTGVYVSILGSEWLVCLVDRTSDSRFDKLNADGFCDYTTKSIYVANYPGQGKPGSEDYSIGDGRVQIKHCIAHEIVHAFMFESGLAADWEHPSNFGQDETVIDWIAWQSPKIIEALKEVYKHLEEDEIQ